LGTEPLETPFPVQALVRMLAGETEFRRVRSQTEFGNEIKESGLGNEIEKK
jgi:hypothetical protein